MKLTIYFILFLLLSGCKVNLYKRYGNKNEVFTFNQADSTFTFSSYTYSLTSGHYQFLGKNKVILNTDFNPLKIELKVEENNIESDIVNFELMNFPKTFYFDELWIILNNGEDSVMFLPNSKMLYYKISEGQVINSFNLVAKPGLLTSFRNGAHLSTVEYLIKNKESNHFIIEPNFDNRYWGTFPFENDTVCILGNKKIFWDKEGIMIKRYIKK